MRIDHSQHDYDRESEYWLDMEEAQNAQIEAQKNLPKGATNGKSEKIIK